MAGWSLRQGNKAQALDPGRRPRAATPVDSQSTAGVPDCRSPPCRGPRQPLLRLYLPRYTPIPRPRCAVLHNSRSPTAGLGVVEVASAALPVPSFPSATQVRFGHEPVPPSLAAVSWRKPTEGWHGPGPGPRDDSPGTTATGGAFPAQEKGTRRKWQEKNSGEE